MTIEMREMGGQTFLGTEFFGGEVDNMFSNLGYLSGITVSNRGNKPHDKEITDMPHTTLSGFSMTISVWTIFVDG